MPSREPNGHVHRELAATVIPKGSDMRAHITVILSITFCFLAHAQSVKTIEKVVGFHNIDVFDGTRRIRRVNVVVVDGMIRAIGAQVSLPAQAEIVEGKGKTLLPGLFDSHTHLGEKFVQQFLRDALDMGITTELEMGGSPVSLEVRKQGCADCADFLTAGRVVTAPGGHPTQMGGPPIPTLSESDDAHIQAFVDARIAEGSDYIKIIDEHRFPTLTSIQLQGIVVAAHRRNTMAIAHIGSQREAVACLQAGVDGLAHVFADSPPDANFASLVTRHHAFVITTLTVFESLSAGLNPRWWEKDSWMGRRLTPTMKSSLSLRLPAWPDIHRNYAEQVVAQLHTPGVPLLAGTDSPAPGLAHGPSLHRELELLVDSGLSPSEALTAATFTPARVFGFHDRGRVAVGLRADLLLVRGDPTSDIRAVHNILGVWKLGTRYYPDEPEGSRGH